MCSSSVGLYGRAAPEEVRLTENDLPALPLDRSAILKEAEDLVHAYACVMSGSQAASNARGFVGLAIVFALAMTGPAASVATRAKAASSTIIGPMESFTGMVVAQAASPAGAVVRFNAWPAVGGHVTGNRRVDGIVVLARERLRSTEAVE